MASKGMPGGALAWALFEGVRVPQIVLITIYVFMPYVATVVIGDPVEGQAAIAEYGKWGGWIVALTSPLLGAWLDRIGPRKPFLALVTFFQVTLVASLWFTLPDGSGLSVANVIVIAAALTVIYAYNDLGGNALLPRAAPGHIAEASGLALALGNGISVLMLIFVLWAFALPGEIAAPGIPAAPLFGLDAASHEPDRIVTLIVAGTLALGCLPMFLLTPDFPRSALSLTGAARAALGDLKRLFSNARGHRDALIFLGARMLYADAKTAILLFSGVYAAGVMGWGMLELLAYGIILSVVAVIGGLFGAWLDRAIGPKRAVLTEIAMIFAAQIAVLGTSKSSVLYTPIDGTAAVWSAPLFRTAPELAFLGIGFVTAIAITAAYASSRTLLVRLVPDEKAGAFFGLYTLSGNATYWLAPLLVEVFTRAYGTQQAGFFPIMGLLALGFAGVTMVRGGLPSR
jgi:UMF1 family MFS transporter